MKKILKAAIFVFITAFLITGMIYTQGMDSQAAGKTTTTTSTKKTTKVTKLNKAVNKKTTKKVSTKNHTKKFKENNYQVTQKTTIKTTTVKSYSAKQKKVIKTVKTTVKTTKNQPSSANTNYNQANAAKSNEFGIRSLQGTIDPMIIKAFEEMNYKIVIKNGVEYAGMFDARNRQITLRSANTGYLLHELGHYVSFITGLKDSTAEFISIYNKEAGKYTGSNKAYVTKNNREYFAESVRDFYTSPFSLRNTRPATYNYVKSCIDSITDSMVDYINTAYYAA